MRAFGRVKPIQWGTESFVFPAAIKLKNDPGDAKREYEMQRMCASAYVVPVEYLEIAHAIVMPAATMDLFAFLDSKERIEPAELWRIVRQMSAAVAAVHRKSVVHRDVKPENFLCFDEPCGDFDDWDDESDETGGDCGGEKEEEEKKEKEEKKETEEEKKEKEEEKENEARGELGALGPRTISSTRMVVRLTDFGYATKLEEGRKLSARAGTRVGSVEYIAPEIAAFEQYDAKADVWSLGVCVFMLLTKCAPFEASSLVSGFERFERFERFAFECYEHYGNFEKCAQKQWNKRSKELTGAQRAVVTRSLTVDQDRRASSADISRTAMRAARALEA